MIELGKILKYRDITLTAKVSTVKAMVFPVVASDCKSWIIQKAVERKMDVFQL